jgi:tetratricopeptide (TPR) repeat protein
MAFTELLIRTMHKVKVCSGKQITRHTTSCASNRYRISTLSCAATLVLLVLPGFFTSAQGQNRDELRHLIFEPVLVNFNQADDVFETTELTSLPQAENPVAISEFIFQQANEIAGITTSNIEDTIVEYEERLSDLELEGGAYEPALSQEYLSIGTLYQSNGEHGLALDYLAKALHINRVSQGLHNLEQEPILDEIIESHVALGDLKSADMQQEYLIYLKRKAHGNSSVELLPDLDRYAEWNIFAFDSRLSMDPTLTYAAESSFFTDNNMNNSIGEDDFRTIRLMNAQVIYHTIIKILLSNYGIHDPRVLDMEKKLALTNYFFATSMGPNSDAFDNSSAGAFNSSQGTYDIARVSSNSMGYRHGREALERRLEYMLEMEDVPVMEIAKAKQELGDWLLMFKKRMAALDLYVEAYADALAAELPQEDMNSLFSPDHPATIPGFINYNYTRAAWNIPDDVALDYKGWVDLRFRLNRFGQAQNLEVLGRSLSLTEPIEDRLTGHIRNSSSFRPRFYEGKLLVEDIVEARYYYTY